MKTRYYTLWASLLIGCFAAGHNHNNMPDKAISKLLPADSSTHRALPSSKENASRAQGMNDNNYPLGYYPGLDESEPWNGYVTEPAASQIGYMGFKVGDTVKWNSKVDTRMMLLYGKGEFITGTINMLDSDRCYIVVDHTNMVAVKLYEDIQKIKP